jgi:hypothetical protein
MITDKPTNTIIDVAIIPLNIKIDNGTHLEIQIEVWRHFRFDIELKYAEWNNPRPLYNSFREILDCL